MNKNDENNIIKSYYEHIGKKHYDNLIDEVDKMEAVDFNFDELDQWVDMYSENVRKKETAESVKKKIKFVTRKAAIIFVVIGIGLTTLVTSVEAFRIQFFNLFVVENSEYTQLDLIQSDELQIDNIQNIYNFPPNFELLAYHNLTSIHILEYEDDLGNSLKFTQSNIEVSIQLDTEDAQFTTIKIGDQEGLYVIKNNITTLYWNDNDKNFSIISTLSLKEIIKMAESVK